MIKPKWGHITEYLAKAGDGDGCEIFVALTDCDSIRVGYAGGPMKAYPKEHTVYAAIVNAVNVDMCYDEIEAVFEELKV